MTTLGHGCRPGRAHSLYTKSQEKLLTQTHGTPAAAAAAHASGTTSDQVGLQRGQPRALRLQHRPALLAGHAVVALHRRCSAGRVRRSGPRPGAERLQGAAPLAGRAVAALRRRFGASGTHRLGAVSERWGPALVQGLAK